MAVIRAIDISSISSEIGFRSMSEDSAEDKSTLVKVMALCSQAMSHYLRQY